MKTKRITMAAAAVAMLSAQLGSASAFATNPYGIEYTGGEPLSADNVMIVPDLKNALTPLIQTEVTEVTPYHQDMWRQGYIKDSGVCRPINYYTVSTGPQLMSSEGGLGAYNGNPGFIVSNGKYNINVEILQVTTENVSDKTITIGVRPDSTFIYAGWQTYTDSECQEGMSDISPLSYHDDSRVYIEMNAKLYKEGSNTPYRANGLVFGITDIDAAQSYKILNPSNVFDVYTTAAESAESLQSTDPTVTLRNMIVPEGGYIYSEYDPTTGSAISTPNTTNIYFEVLPEVQEDGLNFVFGFGGGAASGIEYYVVKHTVKYDTDENGEITGITDEEKMDGEYASGSSYKAKGNYRFSHWVADVDVFLEDGTEIKAGDPITSEQIKKVVVDRDIKFTAIFETDVAVPDTGASTMETNAAQITISVFGVLIGALIIRALPRLTHKKVGFDK